MTGPDPSLSLTRRQILGGLAALPLVAPAAARAEMSGEVLPWAARDRIALRGIDPVSYFTATGPLPGDPRLALRWRGVVWQFVWPEHMLAFERNPRAYAPRFAGFCAWSLSNGQLVQANPEVWAIAGDRLYLAHDRTALTLWQQDVEGSIAKGETHWASLKRG